MTNKNDTIADVVTDDTSPILVVGKPRPIWFLAGLTVVAVGTGYFVGRTFGARAAAEVAGTAARALMG